MNPFARLIPVNGEPTPKILLNLRSVARAVIISSSVILAISYVRLWIVLTYGTGTVIRDFQLFDLDLEATIPSWYSSLVLLGCSGLLLAISRLAKQSRQGDVVRWTVLGVAFGLMGLDEGVAIHEYTIIPLREAFGLSGIFYFAWIIPGAIVTAALAAYMVPILFRLPPRTAIWFAVSGIIYVGGALGVESGGSLIASAGGSRTAQYALVVAVEETLEIVGFTLFFAALADYLMRTWPSWTFRVGAPPEHAKADSQATLPEEEEIV